MNAIFKQLAGNGSAKAPKRSRREKPYTMAFTVTRDENGEVVNVQDAGSAQGIKTLADFPGANCLNIVHKNNKVTVVK